MTPAEDSEDFAALLAEFEKKSPRVSRREAQLGDTVRGRVVSIGRDGAFVELGGGKAEALLEMDDIRDDKGQITVQVGDTVEARVVEVGGKAGCVVLRRSLGRGPEARADLARAAELRLPVDGTVSGVNKGGVEVQVAGVRGFCPISQLDLRHVEDASTFIGQKLRFRVTKYEVDKRGANLVLSRRALLEEEQQAKAAETRTKLVVGAVLPGTVSSLRDFGAFVDLGGLEGLLPTSEISYDRAVKASDVLSVGQPVEVQILRVEKTDDPRRPEKISLSLKALTQNPWDAALEKLVPGTKVKGNVTRTETFGAFVQLAPGVEGLVHIGELSGGKQARHARELVKPGDPLEVTVMSVDREKRRISLGLGDKEDLLDQDALAAMRRSGPQKLGTLGDLFAQRKR
jgi:small subunit ribosomal protein S1